MVFNILMIIFMYLGEISFFLDTYLIKQPNYNETLFKILLLLWLVFHIIAFIFGFINLIYQLIQKRNKNIFKRTMIFKLILIPWYYFNFLIWMIYFAAFINPWLILASPIILIFGVTFTYIFMILNGLNNIIYILKNMIKNKINYKTSIISAIIFQFIFILDVVSSIIFYINRNEFLIKK